MIATILKDIKRYFVDYFSLSDYLVPQEEAEADIREGVSFRGINIMILATAIFIASLGLNTNSTAVIIGAMLISPLMGPIVGLGLGVGVADIELIKRSLRNLMMATALSVVVATIYFLISPVGEHHSELLARTSPTIYDVLIAFFGGAAGILAACGRFKGNVVPGVAIATALMPPLCTAGYGLATWQPVYFFGAFYLYIINSVYIALATFIGVKLMKYHPRPEADPARQLRMRRIVYTVAILVMLPSVYLTYTMIRSNNMSQRAYNFVRTEMSNWPGTQVISQKVGPGVDGERTLTVTLVGRVLPQDSLMLALEPRMKQFGLNDMRLRIIQGDNTAAALLAAESREASATARDVYQMAQSTIDRQAQAIDSLRTLLARRNEADTVIASISPEIKLLFPEVRRLAVEQAVFDNTASQKLDTTWVALVAYSRPMTAARRKTLREYLQTRLRCPEIQIINY